VKRGIEAAILVLIGAWVALVLYAIVCMHAARVRLGSLTLKGEQEMTLAIQASEQLKGAAFQVGNLSNTARDLLKAETAASTAQAKNFTDSGVKLNALLDRADAAVADLDAQIARVGGDLDGNSKALAADLAQITAQSDSTLSQGAAALKTLTDQGGQVGPVLDEVHGAAKNFNAMSADGKQVADHYRDLVLKPVNKAKQAALFVATLAGDVLHAVF
jgi:hypothetical protein